MTKIFMRLAATALTMAFVASAQAQTDDWYVAGSAVYTNDDGSRNIDDSVAGVQINVGRDLTEHLSLEGHFGNSNIDGWYRRGAVDVRDSETHLDLSANLLAFYDRNRRFAPYLTAGIGYLGVDYNGRGDDNLPTASLGVGFKYQLGASRYAIRGEYRARLAYANSYNFTDYITTLGVQANFGLPERQESALIAVPDWYVAGSAVYTNDDSARYIDDSVAGVQINAGRNLTEHLSLEGHFGYSSIDGFYRRGGVLVQDSETHLDLSANLLAFYDRSKRFAPYLTAGVGYLGVDYNGNGNESRPTASLGVGFKYQLGKSRYAIRGEYRARLAYEKNYNFTDYIATLGVQYNFGSRQRDPGIPFKNDKPVDTDGDGVLDMWDECPDTPAGTQVTSRGCELKNIDKDGDNDRIFDHRDLCPNTPPGVPVDPDGCSLDSDLDGVTTDRDYCPGSRLGATVNKFGCEE